LSLKNEVNGPYKHKKVKKLFLVGVLKDTDKKEHDPDPDPDPLARSTDPRIRISTKMSRMRNTSDKRLKCYGISTVLHVHFQFFFGGGGR
jgi:hypothetical protein